MTSFLYIVTLLSAAVGGFLLKSAFSAESAPQQAALAAIAVGMAVIPYVFARSVQLTVSEGRRKKEHDQVVDRLDAIERASSKAAAPRVRVMDEIS